MRGYSERAGKRWPKFVVVVSVRRENREIEDLALEIEMNFEADGSTADLTVFDRVQLYLRRIQQDRDTLPTIGAIEELFNHERACCC